MLINNGFYIPDTFFLINKMVEPVAVHLSSSFRTLHLFLFLLLFFYTYIMAHITKSDSYDESMNQSYNEKVMINQLIMRLSY